MTNAQMTKREYERQCAVGGGPAAAAAIHWRQSTPDRLPSAVYALVWSLVIRASNLIRHSNFVIRILQWYIDQEFEFDSLRSRRKQLALDGAELGADAGVEQAVFDAQDNSADD
jgi:hypothetical protein